MDAVAFQQAHPKNYIYYLKNLVASTLNPGNVVMGINLSVQNGTLALSSADSVCSEAELEGSSISFQASLYEMNYALSGLVYLVSFSHATLFEIFLFSGRGRATVNLDQPRFRWSTVRFVVSCRVSCQAILRTSEGVS